MNEAPCRAAVVAAVRHSTCGWKGNMEVIQFVNYMVNGSYLLLKYREIISSPVRFGNIATEICHLLQEDSGKDPGSSIHFRLWSKGSSSSLTGKKCPLLDTCLRKSRGEIRHIASSRDNSRGSSNLDLQALSVGPSGDYPAHTGPVSSKPAGKAARQPKQRTATSTGWRKGSVPKKGRSLVTALPR